MSRVIIRGKQQVASSVDIRHYKEKSAMTRNRSTGNRKPMLRASLFIIILMVIFASQTSVPSGMARGQKGIVVDIVPDNSASTLSASSPTGTTFYQQGTIYRFKSVNQADCTLRPNAEMLGTWRAWGTVADGGKLVVHQTLSFDLPNPTPLNATIEVQGASGLIAPNGAVTVVASDGATTGPSEVLSVVGGSGVFRALNGVAIVRPYCNPTPEGTTPFRYDRPFCLGVE
jgi:hypothetical protein